MIEKLVEDLKADNGRNYKIETLKRYFAEYPKTASILKRCYNPFEKFYLVKVKATKVGDRILDDAFNSMNTVLDQLSSRTITGNMAKEIGVRFLNTLTKESQEIFMNILKKDLKCGIGIESINAAYPDLVPIFSVQLANKYKADKDYKVEYWYGSYKYDGIRCMYQGKYPDVLHSREGSELVGFDNMVKDLKILLSRMQELPEFSNCKYEDFFVDGELFSNDTSFNDIQGIVLSNKNVDMAKKNSIHLKVFAIGPVSNTAEMIKFFDNPAIFEGLNTLKPIIYFKVNNDPDEIMAKTREFISLGYEGLMLRHPDIAYDWKRSNNLLKSKLHNETIAELTIIGYKSGREGTKYENTLGSFTCKGKVEDPLFTDGKRLDGEYEVTCEVGSGFTDEERKVIWEDPDYYLGKEIIVNYQCISQNANDTSYSLRFPVKSRNGIKLDRTNEY